MLPARECSPQGAGRVCSSVGQSTRLISVGSMVQIHPDPPTWRLGGRWRDRGHSSAGRAPALQAGGHRFDPGWLHQRCGADREEERREGRREASVARLSSGFFGSWTRWLRGRESCNCCPARDRLIFNNSGMNEGGVLEAWWVLFDLPCASTHWVNVLHRVLPY